MRTVTVEVPEGHMVKIVKEESMQSTQKVMGGGKFEFEGETFIPGDVIINPNRGGGSMMILSEIREERPLPFLPAIKVPFGLVAYVPSNDEGDRVFVKLTPEAGIGGMKGFRKATEEEKAKMLAAMKEEKHYSFNFEKLQPEYIPTVSSRPREFHPQPLSEPYVKVSLHTALRIQIISFDVHRVHILLANDKTDWVLSELYRLTNNEQI